MRGEVIIETESGNRRRIEIESSVKLYRMPSRQDRTVVDTGEEKITTKIRDWGVSRRTDDDGRPGYIELFKEDDQIYVKDTGSTNETSIEDGLGEETLQDGERYPIQRDCTIYIGTWDDSSVQVEISNPATVDRSATWNQVGRQVMNLQAWLEAGSVSRIHKQAQILRDDIQALPEDKKGNDELEECISELEGFITQLEVSQDFEDPHNRPTEEVIKQGDMVLSRLRGIVDRN